MDRILMRDLFWQLITDEEYQTLKKLIESAIGVNLNLNRRDFIENLLLKRFKDLDVSDFKAYYEFLKNNESNEKKIINNLFDFGDSTAKDVMIPRIDMTLADVSSSYDDIISLFRQV